MKKPLIATICILAGVIGLSVSTVFTLQLTGVVDVFADKVTVEFRNYDNSFLWRNKIPVGSTAKYEGATPIKESNEEYDYQFVSWDKSLSNVVKDTIYYAQFQNIPKQVKVTFQNYNLKELYSTHIQKGGTAIYVGSVPTRESDEEYSYKFVGWDKDLHNITEDTVFTAQYETDNVDFKVTFRNYDRAFLSVVYVKAGENAKYEGTTPFRKSTPEFDYEFTGWDKDLTNVRENFETLAVFDEKPVLYTVNFYNYDNELLYTDYVSYNGDAVYGGKTPTRPASGEYIYIFKGWNKPIKGITSDLDVLATYETEEREFTTQFYNYDGEYLHTSYSKYLMPAFYEGPTPSRPDDDKYTYRFAGWDRDLSAITEDTVTFALYEKELRKFKCTFKNYDGEPLYITQVTWGDTAKYVGDTPYKPGDFSVVYKFVGWDKPLIDIREDTEFIAQFEIDAEGGGSLPKYLPVYFYNYDGTLLDYDLVERGDTAFYHGDQPTRDDKDGYPYEFVSWSEDLTNVQNKLYVFAQYNWRKYNYQSWPIVTYRSGSLNLLYEDILENYRNYSSYNGPDEPYLSPENGFVGWSKPLSNIYESTTVYPVYEVEM